MAKLGEWRGVTTTLIPTTGWTAPNGLLSSTATRNDDSLYSFNNTTSTLTLPSSGLADGYLITAAFEFDDTSNGRHNPSGRIQQSSGSGNFVASAGTGYNRDNNQSISYVRTWAFIDSPSAGAEFQIQWKRDTDAPSGGTIQAQLQVTPLYYNNHGVYESSQASCPGDTTPQDVSGWSSVSQSDTSAIEISGDTVSLKSNNKLYLCLGGQYWENVGNARTQRWHGFTIDGAFQNAARAYTFARNTGNANIGNLFTTLVETGASTVEVGTAVWRGEAIGTFPNTGAQATGNTTGVNASHALVVLELHSDAQGFASDSQTQQSILSTSAVALSINETGAGLPDGGTSFTSQSTTAWQADFDGDALLGANISGGYASTSTQRFQGAAAFTKNGTDEQYSQHGNYGRGSQGSQSCWGWSANLLGFVAVSDSDTLGASARRTGGQSGPVAALGGWSRLWGLDLDSLEPSSTGISGDLDATETGADTASLSGTVESPAITGSLAATETGSDTASLSGVVESPAITGNLAATEAGSDTASFAGEVDVSGNLAAAEAGADTASFGGGVDIAGALAATEDGTDTASFSGGADPSGSMDAIETGSDTASLAGSVPRSGTMSANETGADVASFLGGVSVTGSLDAGEAGSDTASFSGGLTVSGSLDAAETGLDVATMSGTVPVSGIIGAVEQGDDIAGFEGVVVPLEGGMEEALIERLRGSSSIANACGSYLGSPAIDWLERSPVLPSAVINSITAGVIYAHTGGLNLGNPTVQIDCYAATYGEAEILSRAIIEEMEVNATVSGIEFDESFVLRSDDMEPENLPNGQEVFRITLDFSIWFSPA